jgi:hypothetical protein
MKFGDMLSADIVNLLRSSVNATLVPASNAPRVHSVVRGTMPLPTKLTLGAERPIVRGFDIPRPPQSTTIHAVRSAHTFGIQSRV